MRALLRLRLHLRQIATLRQTQRMGTGPNLCVRIKLQTKMPKTHSVNGPYDSSLVAFSYHWLPLATTPIVNGSRNVKFETFFKYFP